MELYIAKTDVSKFRRVLAMFRSSSQCLMVEKGRHYDIQGDDRHCEYCETIKEDEYHFVLLCPCMRTFVRNIYQMFTYEIERMNVL